MTPEHEAAERFTRDVLALIRHKFYGERDKRFFQERRLLLQAIAFPARWMNDRGAAVPASKYRAILDTVISTIQRHGAVAKIERFSVYFLHAVQMHMKHHGDEYYFAAKGVPSVGPMIGRALRRVRVGDDAQRATEMLALVNRTVQSKGGRKKQPAPASTPDLFESVRPAGLNAA